jgi:hypothetical protein
MLQHSDLKLECMAIGSLPHKNPEEAMNLVKECFLDIPFWPQLTKKSKKEDMMIQYLENMPSFSLNDVGNVVLDSESDEFYSNLESFFLDYEEVVNGNDLTKLEKYGISQEYSSTFRPFLNLLNDGKYKYAKGQIVGPFTLATSLTDKNKKCAIYDETLAEIIVKTLTLKAIWQVKQMQNAALNIQPIIFIDEPSLSQIGTSAFLTISEQNVVDMLKSIVDEIHKFGGIVAIHCCGKCDWSIPIKSGIDIVNLDAVNYSKNLSLFYEDIMHLFSRGGKLAWGVVPTLDKKLLSNMSINDAVKIFEHSVNYLTEKGIDEKLIIDNSIVTPSCGAGGLTVELAEKAMQLAKELSSVLKKKYQNQIGE